MTAWKAKLYDAMRKVDKLGTAEKQKLLPNIEDLHMLLEEMSDRVARLKTECPSDWSPDKKEIEKRSVKCGASTKKPWIISAKPHRYRFRDKVSNIRSDDKRG